MHRTMIHEHVTLTRHSSCPISRVTCGRPRSTVSNRRPTARASSSKPSHPHVNAHTLSIPHVPASRRRSTSSCSARVLLCYRLLILCLPLSLSTLCEHMPRRTKLASENFLTEKMLLQKEIEKMTDKKAAPIRIANVIAEAKEIKEMTAREDVCFDNSISPLICSQKN